ncbi:MAG: hypothetical protein ABGY96_25975 [bacterium]
MAGRVDENQSQSSFKVNLEKLRLAEANFLLQYPGGFDHPDMVAVGKKHRVDKMSEFTAEVLAKSRFKDRGMLLENLVKIVSRSSMVSMFEKPKFRDFVNALDMAEREALSKGFKKMLHGKQERGFNEVLDLFTDGRVAKWSLITIFLVYFRPMTEVFVKPTTAKGIIQKLELDHLVYKPRPSWEFYEAFRTAINDMKAQVDPSLSPNNAAFTGFLMMSL